MVFLTLLLLLSSMVVTVVMGLGLSCQQSKPVSIVTGASGYLGRQIVHELIDYHQQQQSGRNEIICLVREKNVDKEQSYWNDIVPNIISNNGHHDVIEIHVKVMPYDMIDGGITISDALKYAFRGSNDDDASNIQISCVVYHVASIFTPTDDHYEMALNNVKGTEDLLNTIVNHKNHLLSMKQEHNIKVVLTSSTAAVRGPNQKPKNNKYYSYEDWNTQSEHGKNWGNSYQWSKSMSEKKAWDIAKEKNIDMVSLCPSFIFGPPANYNSLESSTSSSYSIQLVSSWLQGLSPVQSRLCTDIRDVAKAHRLAGMLSKANGQRLIVSSEARLSSQQVANEFQRIAREVGFDESRVDMIHADLKFDGGAIAIGDKEVDAEKRLKEILGLNLRGAQETMSDMARTMLNVMVEQQIID